MGFPGPGTFDQNGPGTRDIWPKWSQDQGPLHLGPGPFAQFLLGPGTKAARSQERSQAGTRDHKLELQGTRDQLRKTGRDQGPSLPPMQSLSLVKMNLFSVRWRVLIHNFLGSFRDAYFSPFILNYSKNFSKVMECDHSQLWCNAL